ncbi:uncharacterized protein LOC143892674 isoform X2 [Tasmannia lanceolata]|uniref:uncharacterized protein LOC143892674 isoform X2 n=1 Tax=Tasmannia lanceolata TaxID=3420 RepID=UPI004063B90E
MFESCSTPLARHRLTASPATAAVVRCYRPPLSLSLGLFERQSGQLKRLSNAKVVGKSSQFIRVAPKAKRELPKRQLTLFAISEDQSPCDELNSVASEQEKPYHIAEEASPESNSYLHIERPEGKPGLISFYGIPYGKQDDILVSSPGKDQSNLLWFIGPAVLVASLVFPSLYLRRILSTVFEDSLLTDFLILFFTEALFYGGVGVFVLLIDHLQRPLKLVAPKNNTPLRTGIAHRISSVATLVLSLIIPLVTMGLVWPWTGPAASATLAPYLVGLVVQFAFEQYARYRKSPAWPVIPVIFQVYRLHQLNRAAQLVTALSFSVRGAETTSQTLAINTSLGTLLNVLQFLGVICIWSLSSFLMSLIAENIRNPRWVHPQSMKLQRNFAKSSPFSTKSCLSIRNEGFRRERHSVGDGDGVVIVDHGSRRKESNLMLNEFVAMFREKTKYPIVEAAHMELAKPSIKDAFDSCVQQGADRVIISPFFLFPGRHWHQDIPSLVAEAAKDHPGVSYLVTAPLGLHDLMVDVMNDRIKYCLSHVAGDSEECTVCSGTGKCRLR